MFENVFYIKCSVTQSIVSLGFSWLIDRLNPNLDVAKTWLVNPLKLFFVCRFNFKSSYPYTIKRRHLSSPALCNSSRLTLQCFRSELELKELISCCKPYHYVFSCGFLFKSTLKVHVWNNPRDTNILHDLSWSSWVTRLLTNSLIKNLTLSLFVEAFAEEDEDLANEKNDPMNLENLLQAERNETLLDAKYLSAMPLSPK